MIEPAFMMKNPTRTGNHSFSLCPYGVFPGKNNQYMIVCAPSNKLWTKLCELIGRPDAAQTYDTAQKRISNLDKIIEIISDFAKQYDDIGDAVKYLDENGIPCCKVQTTNDVINDAHFRYRGSIAQLPTTASLQAKGIKTITARGPWAKLSKTPPVFKAPPVLGEHNHEVLESYGFSKEKIDSLVQKWREKAKAKA